jgi:hypothetical protein
MRRPVSVKSFCGWASSHLLLSFARIGVSMAAAAGHSKVLRRRKTHDMLVLRPVIHNRLFTYRRAEIKLSSPFHPHSV